jgi:hypothetical protein
MNLFMTKGARYKGRSRKEAVMKRYHQELERTRRVHRRHLRGLHNWPVSVLHCVCEFQIGRFRKRKAFGCGRSRCLLCHFEKIFGISSVKTRIGEQRYLDSINDYLNN